MRLLQRSKGFILLILLLTSGVSVISASGQLFSDVQQICRSYQIDVDRDKMTLGVGADNQKIFRLVIPSARNNFDRVLIIGFYAAGKAIEQTGEAVDQIVIDISIEYKGYENIRAMASREDVMKYVTKTISASQFVRLIKFI